MKKLLYLFAATGLVALSLSAKADTLQVVHFGTTTSDSSIGPYTFSLNGTSTVQLFCLDDFLTISQGESWNVNIVSGDDLTSELKQYAEAAYIFSELGKTDTLASNGHGHSQPTFDNTDVQDALWNIFDPGGSPEDRETKDLLKLASENYSSVDMSLYDFYIPDGGLRHTQPGDTSVPQTFIGLNPDPTPPTPPTVTPEPSSLVLFGSGLLGVAGVVRRKLARD